MVLGGGGAGLETSQLSNAKPIFIKGLAFPERALFSSFFAAQVPELQEGAGKTPARSAKPFENKGFALDKGFILLRA